MPWNGRRGGRRRRCYVGIDEGAGLVHRLVKRLLAQGLDISQGRRGVPTLVIGDVVLVNTLGIPEQLPGLIKDGLAQGGTDWPAIPGLAEALAASAPAARP